jgi:hypothetical protein
MGDVPGKVGLERPGAMDNLRLSSSHSRKEHCEVRRKFALLTNYNLRSLSR